MNPRLLLGVAIISLLSSCTKTLYSSQEILQKHRTKDAVIRYYGLPTENKEYGDYKEFYYYYGTKHVGRLYSSSTLNSSATISGNRIYGSATGTQYSVGQAYSYDRYVKYTFDRYDRVISAESRGVDLSIKTKAPGKTVLFSVGMAGLAVFMGYAMSQSIY